MNQDLVIQNKIKEFEIFIQNVKTLNKNIEDNDKEKTIIFICSVSGNVIAQNYFENHEIAEQKSYGLRSGHGIAVFSITRDELQTIMDKYDIYSFDGSQLFNSDLKSVSDIRYENNIGCKN